MSKRNNRPPKRSRRFRFIIEARTIEDIVEWTQWSRANIEADLAGLKRPWDRECWMHNGDPQRSVTIVRLS